jgi:hypothetical protein
MQYSNPVAKNLTIGRIDEGVDFSSAGELYAMGDGQVENVNITGWPGNIYILLHMDDGRYVYYAENISPDPSIINATQARPVRVKAGDKIGYARGYNPWIEVGWATSTPGNALAHGHYSEGVATAEGKDFAAYLARFGWKIPGAAATSTYGAGGPIVPGAGGTGPAGGAPGAAPATTTPTGNTTVDTALALLGGAAVPAVMILVLFGLTIILAVGITTAGTVAAARAATS